MQKTINSLPETTKSGDEDKLVEHLYKQYWNPLINFTVHYLGDKESSEELVQDLFIRMHTKRSVLKIRSSLSSYLYAALRNRIFNHFREQAVYKRHLSMAARIGVNSQNNVEQSMNLKDLQDTIAVLLNRMPARCREVYVLRDRDQLTLKRISEILHRPINTVEKQLRRATRLLREELSRKEWRSHMFKEICQERCN